MQAVNVRIRKIRSFGRIVHIYVKHFFKELFAGAGLTAVHCVISQEADEGEALEILGGNTHTTRPGDSLLRSLDDAALSDRLF